MVKAMKTTEDLTTGTYVTVAEVFVPAQVLGQKTLSLGVAFKTCDKDYRDIAEIKDNAMKFRGDPWWFFAGRFPLNMAERFILE